jgi:2-(1,2-epoxy-1,2-dihydrophenyl)acetyl-CoA isomerase
MPDYTDILYELDGNVATITLNRPNMLNAFGRTLGSELIDALGRADGDDDVRAVILTGAGRGFCSGADLREAQVRIDADSAGDKISTHPRNLMLEPLGRWAVALNAIRRMHKPIIAAVNGLAVGGGMSLAFAADIRIASDQARFSAIFAKRGLAMEAGTSYFLPRLIGLENTFRMVYTADMVPAADALKLGLVSEVVPHDELMPAARALAAKIASLPTVQLAIMRDEIYRSASVDLDTAMRLEMNGLGISQRTWDYHEGHQSFAEKREPQFRGR